MLPRDNITAVSYITDILDPHEVPFAPFVVENFPFMQDNARPNTAVTAQSDKDSHYALASRKSRPSSHRTLVGCNGKATSDPCLLPSQST